MIKIIIDNYFKLKENLLNNSEEYSIINKAMGNHRDLIFFIIENMFYKIEMNGKEIFYLNKSRKDIFLLMNNVGIKVTEISIYNAISKMCLLDIIEYKEDVDYTKIINNKNENINNSSFYSNVYFLNNLSSEKIKNVLNISKIIVDNKIVHIRMSHALIYNIFGINTANKVFPHSLKRQKETRNKIILNNEQAKFRKAYLIRIENYLEKELENKGFCEESLMIRKIARDLRIRKNNFNYHYKNIVPKVIQNKDLIRIKSTKELKKYLNIEDKNSKKDSYYNILMYKKDYIKFKSHYVVDNIQETIKINEETFKSNKLLLSSENPKKYYVYFFKEKDSDYPFYIGKGKGNRYLEFKGRNRECSEIINNDNFDSIIFKDNLDEDEAFRLEKLLIISCIKNKNINLTNVTYYTYRK